MRSISRAVKVRMWGAAAMAALAMAGCAPGALAPPMEEYRAEPAQPAAAPAEYSGGAAASFQDTAPAGELDNRLIVRNANLSLVVDDTAARLDAITGLVSELKGYISSSSTVQYDEGLQAQVTLRLPADRLDEALRRLRAMAVEVREERISGEDVTAEYTDLNARLRNLEAAETQLREIMAEAQKTEDVLAVFNQLTQVRGEIESIKGRIQYLSQAAAMATVVVNLIPDEMARPVQVAGWRLDGTAKQAFEALIGALQALATLAVWLIIVVAPVALILASPFIVIYLLYRRRKARRGRKPQA